MENGELKRTDGLGFDWILTGTLFSKKEMNWDSYNCSLFLPSPLHTTFEAKGKGKSFFFDLGRELNVPIDNSEGINKNEIKSLINKSYFTINYQLNEESYEEKIELHIE